MAAGDRGSRGRKEYGGRSRASSSFGSSPGPIGGGSSYGLDKDTFNRTIGSGNNDRDRDRNYGTDPVATPEPDNDRNVGSATQPEDEGRRPQYGRYSTPGPVGGPASYGNIAIGTYDAISEPHQPASPDRYESWARDVLGRDASGQPPSERDLERLQSGVSGYRGQQFADTASTLAGLANPYAGAAVSGGFKLGSQLASPEFQAGTALANQPTTTGTIAGAVGTLAGAAGNAGLSTASKLAGAFGSPIEQQFSDTGQLVGQIERKLGGSTRASNVFGSGSRDRNGGSGNTDYTYGDTGSPTVMQQQPQQLGFQAADPYQYETFLNNFTVG